MRVLTPDEMAALEKLIDGASLQGVLEAMAGICTAKAEHIESNWQDSKLAQSWDYRAAALEKEAANAQGL